jgi:hypothetical protein
MAGVGWLLNAFQIRLLGVTGLFAASSY